MSGMINPGMLACPCGCGLNNVKQDVLNRIQVLATLTNSTPKIISGCRCAKHNKAIKGSTNSQHLYGNAVDVIFVRVDNTIVDARIICCIAQILNLFSGIANISAKYQSVHLDMRPKGSYRGDELKGFNYGIPSTYTAYYGISNQAIINNMAVPPVRIARGTVSTWALSLQLALKLRGNKYCLGGTDGNFGSNSVKGLIQYQKDVGITADGIAFNQTFGILYKKVA